MTDLSIDDIKRFHNLLIKARYPVIITHMKPDGDALGSSMAMYGFIRMSGGLGKVILPHRYPRNLDFLVCPDSRSDVLIHEETSEMAEEAIRKADLIICLDFNAFHRTDRLEGCLRDSSAEKVLIDHHLNPDRERFGVIFSETQVSSASELLFHILMKMPEIGMDASNIPGNARTALLTGMTTDTNNFGNSVYPSTLQMASALLAAGTDRDAVLDRLYNNFSEGRLRLMGHMMKDLLKITDDGVAYIVLDRKTQSGYGIEEGDTEGFVNMPLSIERVRMSLLVKEDTDRLRVSIRSKKGVSANRCAVLHFNGGGHENAAGGRLRIPEDLNGIEEAGNYIERETHIFINEENEK